MNTPASNLSVWVGDKVVCIKIAGRANFTASVDFRALVYGLAQQGQFRFVLDLSECQIMDSTFLGVLAGIGLKLGSVRNGNSLPTIELFNPNTRIVELLENLGVSHLFPIIKGEKFAVDTLAPLETAGAKADKTQLSRTCLEAHQTLMNINPGNVPKFKEIARFLAEDLKKLEEKR